MSFIQPVLEPTPPVAAVPVSEAPFGAIVARQVSVWPFGARTARLFLLVDPSLPDQTLYRGLLRAMQQGYFGSDGYSQTRAVREAALAAHYVLRHHNRDVLPVAQVNAASALAAVRGEVAFVALAGHAAAFAWRDGALTGQRGILRLPRPLGLEQDPVISLWSTPLRPGDRLILVCGATWRPDSEQVMREILASATSTAEAQAELAAALGSTRRAGVLVVTTSSLAVRAPHLRLIGGTDQQERLQDELAASDIQGASWWRTARRCLMPLLGLLLLGLVALASLTIVPQPPASESHSAAVRPRLAVRLGQTAANVVDLAVGDEALYTLDVVEGAVRAFALDALDQQPTPGTLLATRGTPVGLLGRALETPVAIEYLPDVAGQGGSLAIVDQARDVVQVVADRQLSLREVPTSTSWLSLGALGAGSAGELLFLDSRAHQLLAYPNVDQPVLDPPSVVADGLSARGLAFERVAQVVSTADGLVLRLDDGSLQRLDPHSGRVPLAIPPGDDAGSVVTAIASDRAGGLYLADVANGRVLQTTGRGLVVREFRHPALASVRAMDATRDGRQLYALVDAGVLVVDLPDV